MPRIRLSLALTVLSASTLAVPAGAQMVDCAHLVEGTDRAAIAAAGFVPGEILVRFEPGVAVEDALQRLESAGAESVEKRYADRIYLARTEPSVDATLALVQEILSVEGVEVAEPNFVGCGGATPNDPRFPEQWHLEQPSDIDIDATEAWELPQGRAEVVIAVLDSGTQFDQPEIEQKLHTNEEEDPGNGVDDDGNGLVDDWRGWDFTSGDNDPSDLHGHGTGVAGTTVALAGNGFQVAGVAQTARYVPIRVLDADNLGSTAALVDALKYVTALGEVDLVNLSLIEYPTGSVLLRDALTGAAAESILISCAGNGGTADADAQYPGAHPDTISVNATDRWDALASFASTGDTVNLSAPGVDIYTVDPHPPYEPEGAVVDSGCSYATPIVTGIAAMLHAHWTGMDRESLETYLAMSAKDLGPTGWDSGFGWGRVNARGALEAMFSDWIFANGFEPGEAAWSSGP